MIRLVGPGGAGKSSTGSLLAVGLGARFVDLDERFGATVGDISKYIESHGYDAYAARNVQVYADVIRSVAGQECVLALSSGFMTYREDVHPPYARFRRDIVASPTTFVLLPSLDLETCVAETVRRQLGRPFSRSAEREEQVIRARFALYRDLPATTIETMRPVAEVVEAVAANVAAQRGAVLDASLRDQAADQPAMKPYRIVVEQTGTGFSAYSPDLPGCAGTGRTREEAETSMREAIEFHVDGLRLEGYPVPEPASDSAHVGVRRAIEDGLADSAAGRTTPVEEVRRRFGLDPAGDLPPGPEPVG
jgi:predicted RNase H-like HicB family nuclease/shikimate kinase